MKRILAFVLVLALALPVLAQSVDEYKFTLVPRRPATLPANAAGYLLNDGSGGLSWGALDLSPYVRKDGTTALTADWNVGAFVITSKNITSTSTATGLGIDALKNNSGAYNTAVGVSALRQNSGGDNTAVGELALGANTGNSNVALGLFALQNNTGSYNVGAGIYALASNIGGYNVCLGYNAGFSNDGTDNIGIGSNAMNTATGSNNVGIGSHALYDASGNSNSALGFKAGYYKVDGNHNAPVANNLYLGANCRSLVSGGSNEIIIGESAYGAGSNTARIGNTSITEVQTSGGYISQRIVNADSDTDEIDSVVFAGGYGMVIAASTTDGTSAIWKLEGTTFTAISVDADWTAVKDNASTYNVYFDSGAIKLQNKVGDDKAVKLGFFGI